MMERTVSLVQETQQRGTESPRKVSVNGQPLLTGNKSIQDQIREKL